MSLHRGAALGWTRALPLASFAVVCWVGTGLISNSDTGYCLALGRLVSRGTIPQTNALAWTAPDEAWYATSWLYDLVLFRLVDAVGPGGAQVLTLALVALVALGLRSAVRAVLSDNLTLARVVLAVGLLLLAPRVDSRSYLASWVVLAWTLALCLRAARGDWRLRATCVFLIALGSNFHTGAAFGAGVLGLFCLEAALRERRFVREAVIAVAGVLALAANPGGLALLQDLFAHLYVEQLVALGEYRRPAWATEPVLFLLAPALVVLGVRQLRRREHLALVGVSATFIVLGFRNVRFSYELYIVALPLLALGAAWLAERTRQGQVYAAAGVVGLVALVAAVPVLAEVRPGPGFNTSGLAVRAAEFARREGLSGPLYNSYHDGGYLAWALDAPIFMDPRPRAYPQSFWNEAFAAEQSPATFQAWLDSKGVEWAITAAYPTALTGNRLLDDSRWALVYWDEVNEVWLRRDVPRFHPLIARLEFRHFRRDKNPYDAVVGTIERASPEVLAQYANEVERYRHASPDEPWGRIASCLVDRKLGRFNPGDVCADIPLAR